MTAGTRLKAWRERNGVSQVAAAERVGVRQNTWSDWEHDLKEPRLRHALSIARITDGEVGLEHWPYLKPGRSVARQRTGTEG